MAYMVVIYKTPKDPEAFNHHYFETHVPLAKKLPGLRKYEVSLSSISSSSGNSDTHLIAILYFDDMDAIRRAFASDAGQACAADRSELAPDTSIFQMFLFDSELV